jgi:putative Mn2+ efflux pump MntP
MPIVGWSAGQYIYHWVEAVAHWIAFGLLFFIAQGMIRSAFNCGPSEAKEKDPTRGSTMVMLSIATSIDALAVGLSLSMLKVSIWVPALIIGLIAGAFTTVGMHLGKKLSRIPQLSCYAELMGGVLLLLIGANILREHGVFNAL